MNATGANSSFSLMRGAGNAALMCALATLVAGCGEGQQASGRAAAAGGDGGEADQAHGLRLRRICRPLHRGQFGRSARARFRLSRRRAFQGRADRQAGRSAVHHRQAAVPEHARSGARQSGAGQVQSHPSPKSDFTRGQQLVRDKTITEQTFEQRTQAFRNAQASVANAEAAVRQAELDHANSPSCARRSTAASATAASRPAISSPAAPAAIPRCSPPSSRPIRSISSSPSMRHRFCATSGCRRPATTSPAAAPACRWRSS